MKHPISEIYIYLITGLKVFNHYYYLNFLIKPANFVFLTSQNINE